MAHAGVNDLVRKQQWVSHGWRRRVIRQRKKECSAVMLRQWTAAITRSGSSHILRKILWVWSEAFITLDILLVIIYWLGHWCQRANAKGSDAHSPSGVIVNAEKVKRSVYFCGWHKDGHPACKTSHKTPLFSRWNWLTQVYVKKWCVRCVCVFTGNTLVKLAVMHHTPVS